MINFKITSVVKKGHRPSGRLILETDEIERFEELIDGLGVDGSLCRDKMECFISVFVESLSECGPASNSCEVKWGREEDKIEKTSD